MSRLILPHEKIKFRSFGVVWCFAGTLIPSVWVGFCKHPFGKDHIGLLLYAVILVWFIQWTANNLDSGVYTSKQGIHRRDEAPFHYWINTSIVAAATVLLFFGWLHQMRTVSQIPQNVQPAKTPLE